MPKGCYTKECNIYLCKIGLFALGPFNMKYYHHALDAFVFSSIKYLNANKDLYDRQHCISNLYYKRIISLLSVRNSTLFETKRTLISKALHV